MGCCAGRHIEIQSRSSSPSAIAGELRSLNDLPDEIPRSLNDLPDEILLKILSHFGPEDLYLITAKVCKRWNALSKDVALRKTMSYSCDKTSDISRVVEVLRVAPAPHSLIIGERGDAVRILRTLIDSHVDIRKLELRNCWIGWFGTGLLTEVVTSYPDLEALSLEWCSELPSDAYCPIADLKSLTELNLSHCEELSRETVRHIAGSCQHLKKLCLDGLYEIDDDDAVDVIKKLGRQLTTLVLRGTFLTDVTYLNLNKCYRLQELKILDCRGITHRGLLEGIGSLQQLTSLSLTGCPKLTAQELSTFLHRPSMTSIVSFKLSYCCCLDDEGLKGIAKRCVQLKELSVLGCENVTDAGISMVIRNCRQLRVLNLNSVRHITGNGWLPLVPAHLPHLRKLYLRGCDIACDEYIEELVAAAPQLKVMNHEDDIVRKVQHTLTYIHL